MRARSLVLPAQAFEWVEHVVSWVVKPERLLALPEDKDILRYDSTLDLGMVEALLTRLGMAVSSTVLTFMFCPKRPTYLRHPRKRYGR
jgi:hypothetical protein